MQIGDVKSESVYDVYTRIICTRIVVLRLSAAEEVCRARLCARSVRRPRASGVRRETREKSGRRTRPMGRYRRKSRGDRNTFFGPAKKRSFAATVIRSRVPANFLLRRQPPKGRRRRRATADGSQKFSGSSGGSGIFRRHGRRSAGVSRAVFYANRRERGVLFKANKLKQISRNTSRRVRRTAARLRLS